MLAHFVDTQLNDQTVLFQIIQFSMSFVYRYQMSNSSVWPIDRTLSSATTTGQSGPGSNSNEGVLCIPKAPALQEPHHQIV